MRTTVDISDALHEILRHKAEESGNSIGALIVHAIEQTYAQSKGKYVTDPMIKSKGKLGPRFPTEENPHDLVFPDLTEYVKSLRLSGR